jgi:hypothetical protein
MYAARYTDDIQDDTLSQGEHIRKLASGQKNHVAPPTVPYFTVDQNTTPDNLVAFFSNQQYEGTMYLFDSLRDGVDYLNKVLIPYTVTTSTIRPLVVVDLAVTGSVMREYFGIRSASPHLVRAFRGLFYNFVATPMSIASLDSFSKNKTRNVGNMYS